MQDIQYELEPNAVLVHYTADEQLNQYNDQPHALTLVVYQLTMPDLYYKYVAKDNGIEELLRMEGEQSPRSARDPPGQEAVIWRAEASMC